MTNQGNNIEQYLDGELEPLLLSVLDNQASDQEYELLIDSLRSSEKLRKRVCLFLCDESLLSEEIGATQQASKLVEMLSFSKQAMQESKSSDPQVLQNKLNPLRLLEFINGNGLIVAALAACIVLGLFVQNMLMLSKMSRLHSLVVQGNSKPEVEVITTPQGDGVTELASLKKREIVGRVIGLNELQWQPGEKEYTFGDSLREGQRLQIASGELEILLTNGAKVTAEGPVDFEVTSQLMMELDLGKVVAAVPRTARGYTILTPTTEVVDIGTQFGLSVDEFGETELHVFDGDVVARSLIGETESELIHAKENEAIVFDSYSTDPRRLEAREADFVRRLGPEISKNDYPAIPHTKNLAVWYSADMIPAANDGDTIATWQDILIGENKFANDARQFDPRRCPTLVTDQNGNRALRFNGWFTNLVTDPIENTGCTTVFVACSPQQTNISDKLYGGYIFKAGDTPSLAISMLSDRSARAWVSPTPNMSRLGLVQSSPMDKQINIIAYKYDTKESQAELWINGISQGRSTAPVKLRHHTRAWIGRHSHPDINAYFSGDIYEIIAYNACLDKNTMQDFNLYFSSRYKID